MAHLPESICTYLSTWLCDRCAWGYILMDNEGHVLTWGGAMDQLGIQPLENGRPVSDQLYFMEGLLPMDEPSIQLPMIKTNDSRSLDVHLFHADEGYGLLLMDVSGEERKKCELQQKANDLALLRAHHDQLVKLQKEPDQYDPLGKLFFALNIAALALGPDGCFTLLGRAPGWLTQFCPQAVGQPCTLNPENVFSFLENFLHDAHDFWAKEIIGSIKSGLWIETDTDKNEYLFEATAINSGQIKLLLISHDNCNNEEKRTLIQRGRDLALDHGLLQRMQKELQAARDCLEERVQARTRELQETNARLAEELTLRKLLEKERAEMLGHLQQAQKMEAIGTLAGGIAHDFNNILSAVIGFTELSLNQTSRGSVLHTNMNHVYCAALRAKELTKQILTFSRQAKPETQPVKLNDIVVECLKLLRASLPASIEIKHKLESQSFVLADPTQLHQVVMNLCANAGHAMKTKGGLLELNLRDRKLEPGDEVLFPDLEQGLYMEFIVQDNGQGMTPQTLERIYDPFFTTKKKGQGTGMGLSVVHGIVKNCHGTIKVSSRIGLGSTFRVLLPAIEQMEVTDAHPAPKLPKGSESILFIDDEQPIVDVTIQGLGYLGYRVEAMTDCARALKIFAQDPARFDLVITDMNMPKMTGKNLALEMLKIRPDIPIVLCTGYSDVVTEANAKEIGIRGYLMKPVAMKKMAETIREILDSS